MYLIVSGPKQTLLMNLLVLNGPKALVVALNASYALITARGSMPLDEGQGGK